MVLGISITKFVQSQWTVLPYPSRSFAGETCIVTGSNVGLGKEAARHLARLGAAKVILAVRNLESGEAAKADIEASTERKDVCEVWKLDLSSYDSVKAFAKRASELPRLDVLLENAALATNSYRVSEGHEHTVTVNVISTFLLALLMLPKLKATAKQFDTKPRLTIVSSEAHAMTDFAEKKHGPIFPSLDDPKIANMNTRYHLTKLIEILVIRQIAPKLKGSGVILNTLNPGFCESELTRELGGIGGVLLRGFKLVLARSTEVGSRTLMSAVAAGPESHGSYMNDCVVEDTGLSAYAQSAEADADGKQIWKELSEILEKIQPGVTGNL